MLLNINMQTECLKKGVGLFLTTCGFNKFMYFERVNFKHIYITMSVPSTNNCDCKSPPEEVSITESRYLI
jgi:hypothetical protein